MEGGGEAIGSKVYFILTTKKPTSLNSLNSDTKVIYL
jgi:hypothetical protein